MRSLIVTATLEIDTGTVAVNHAKETAGIACDTFVSVDQFGQGGCKTANVGWEKALDERYDCLVYMNDDVSNMPQGWLTRLIEVLESDESYGIAVPGGACNTYPQSTCEPGLSKEVIVVPMAAFFVAVLKLEVLETVGLLDAEFIHFGCDSDYVERARRTGWKVVYVQDLYVTHDYTKLGARPEHVQRWKVHDEQLFFKRWGYK